MDKESLNEVRELSRSQYYDIWQHVKEGKTLEGEEKIIGDLMALHKEFYSYWDSTDFDYEFTPEHNEVNPFMHLMLDTIVMNQITANDPPQTKFTYNKLTARGDSHLEAIHKIASVVVKEIWTIMQEGKPFNEKYYVHKLKELK